MLITFRWTDRSKPPSSSLMDNLMALLAQHDAVIDRPQKLVGRVVDVAALVGNNMVPVVGLIAQAPVTCCLPEVGL